MKAWVVLAIALTCNGTIASAAAQDSPGPGSAPAAALITGVPFISWHEAARLRHPFRNVNPSHFASLWMMRGYWRETVESPRAFEQVLSSASADDLEEQIYEPATLDDIKRLIARGVPVMMVAPLTTVAHPLSLQVEAVMAMLEAVGKAPSPPLPQGGGPSSDTLGTMVALADIPVWSRELEVDPIRNEMTAAVRVAIGYDDVRRVLILHDPSIGPAWELSYDDFERMWALSDPVISFIEPDDRDSIVAERQCAPPYRARTADERAAELYLLGYALSATGRTREGEAAFRTGLALPGVGRGYRHLLLFDLALTLSWTMRVEEAIAAARESTDEIPENPAPWSLLSVLYEVSGSQLSPTLSSDALERMKSLVLDERAERRLATSIPSDFFVTSLGPIRGWAAR